MERVFDLILVPQGAEYKAVYRGLKGIKGYKPKVLPIPMGYHPVKSYLSQNQHLLEQSKILVMGVGGSLSPKYQVGDILIYSGCTYLKTQKSRQCCPLLTTMLKESIGSKAHLVRGLTSDRLICSPAEKQELGEINCAKVIDMESFAVLEKFTQVAIVRVVSDHCEQQLPELTPAISSEGKLKKIALAIALGKQPLAAIKLITHSLTALKILQEITSKSCNLGGNALQSQVEEYNGTER